MFRFCLGKLKPVVKESSHDRLHTQSNHLIFKMYLETLRAIVRICYIRTRPHYFLNIVKMVSWV